MMALIQFLVAWYSRHIWWEKRLKAQCDYELQPGGQTLETSSVVLSMIMLVYITDSSDCAQNVFHS